jgi:micrococcal nuclease
VYVINLYLGKIVVDEKTLIRIAWIGTIFGLVSLFFITEYYYNIPTLEGPFNVTYVVDGDTLDIQTGERVRLSGINTPESGECYYLEAKEELKKLTMGKQVLLENDVESAGKYGRRLAYIHVDQIFVNGILVEKGFAKVYDKYNSTTRKYKELKELEKQAIKANLGVWACVDQKKDCMFVASKNSNIYHKPGCKWAKKIKEENLVCFKSLQETKGYEPAKSC